MGHRRALEWLTTPNQKLFKDQSRRGAVTDSGKAVFLSYATQDAEAAGRICEALRAAGIAVWFDQSELRGGDAWDSLIRRQIKACYLFVPLISANTQAREEGYFRREWKLAVDRTLNMAESRAFLLPVVIDGTSDLDALVPEKFREVQWTRLPGGVAPTDFIERVRRLSSVELLEEPIRTVSAAAPVPAVPRTRKPVLALGRSKAVLFAMIAMVVVALGYLVANRFVLSKRGAEVGAIPGPTVQSTSTPAFNPPPHSIAVLPFVNMSGDKDQEYFSDGLTEELLNSLTEINELQVAARTSAFSFKGKDLDISTIARKLNVGAVLEGSVRRSRNTVRVTAQLVNAVTGFHLWSHTYDRDLGDVLTLESEIARAVAGALRVSLLGDVSTKIELGGSRNPAAFDAYLRGRKAALAAESGSDFQNSIAAFTEAVRLDPNYALAFANRSLARINYALIVAGAVDRESIDKAQPDALKALALAPELAEGHLALAFVFKEGLLDYTRANQEFERALVLAPGNARVLRDYSPFAVAVGRTDAGIAAARRAVVLDPLDRDSHWGLGTSLYLARQNREALAAYQDTLTLDPEYPGVNALRGFAYYAIGDFESARALCETKPDKLINQVCLAVAYDKLGRHADAESMLARIKTSRGDGAAYQYAEIYAQWGNSATALDWLDTASRLRDPGLETLQVNPLLDPLRKQPRFQAVAQSVERELKFPR
jgi:TolB-like protein